MSANITIQDLKDAIASDLSVGFCMHCGTKYYNIPPDAQRLKCNVCDLYHMYSAEEILKIGLQNF